MKIIAFTGMPFSGKSEAVKIAKEQNIPVIRMGDMVWEETKKQNLELNDKNVGTIANNMRKKYGMDIWAKKTIEKIKKIKNTDILVIDGVRNLEEVETFKKKLGDDFLLVAIQVSDKLRYKRAMNRNRKDDSKDLAKIKERDNREISWGLNTVIDSADMIISNEGSLEELHNKIKQVFV
ncbi:MAG: flagellar hook-basal body complex protein FliE [Candidatus Thermoplasmatota archaeon]|nr:flagellar hook-basal body complex protein FliE [Candidatus Thermoplasmatota archaeon]